MVAKATIGGKTTATSLRMSRTLLIIGDRVFFVLWVLVVVPAVSQGNGVSLGADDGGAGVTNPVERDMFF